MPGQVWEWTLSLWGEEWEKPDFAYPYNPNDGRENVEAGEDIARVVRGGSFYYGRRSARCSVRFRSGPDLDWRDGGFRVAVSPTS